MPRNNQTALDEVYDGILGRARSHPLLKGIPVLDGQSYDGNVIPTADDGSVLPYVVIKFGGRGQVSTAQRGIVGSRGDSKMLYWGAEVYAATAADKRRVADDVLDIFDGWEPPGAGEIDSPYSGAIENPIENVRNSVREGVGLIFRCMVNNDMPSDVYGGAIA